jgi:hypothetical protein
MPTHITLTSIIGISFGGRERLNGTTFTVSSGVAPLRKQRLQTVGVGWSSSPECAQGLVDELLAALENEGKVWAHGWVELTNLINDFQTLTLEQVLKKLFGILAEAVLGSVKTVMDALLKILANIARSLLELLDTKIHIPVIFDILNEIGVPDISFLDLFCWISALAVTVRL